MTDTPLERSRAMAERRALTLPAAAMFAEARELAAESELRARLSGYCGSLLHGRPDDGRRPELDYRIEPVADGPVLRRLATQMDALALVLGSWSSVGRALSGWSSRITVEVAGAEVRDGVLPGPSDELLEVVEALARGVEPPDGRTARRGTEPTLAPPRSPASSDGETRNTRIWSRR